MRLSNRLVLAGLVAAWAAPAVVAQTATVQVPQVEQPKNERLICRRIQESGSIARVRRQCYTRAQWDRIAQDQRGNSPAMSAMSGSQNGN